MSTSSWTLPTPVAFLIFNRPQSTSSVFAAIRRARPPRLLIVADGPRAQRPGEAERCAQARAVAQQVDWPCEVETEFSAVNLGCRERVASGIDWVFSRVPEAIILEDDCVPEPTFFRFCSELLERYRDDPRVGMIGGTNVHADASRGTGGASYRFSKYTPIWGWATWRRAWARYDRSAASWSEFERSGAFRAFTTPRERTYWQSAFDGVRYRTIDTWDYQWTLTCWCESMLAVLPRKNLISNIGHGPDATHTFRADRFANLPAAPMTFPLLPPALVLADRHADAAYGARAFGESWPGRIKTLLGIRRLRRQRNRARFEAAGRATPAEARTGVASSAGQP